MIKRVFIIHGWEGSPKNCWFPWLKKELEKKDFKVFIPSMPNPEEPKINAWVNTLKKIINPDENTFLIGHSIGCQTIMRYLEQLKENQKVCGVIFVAGFFNLPNLKTDEEKEIAKPWLKTPINTDKIKIHTKKFIAIFSDDDPDVPLSDSEIFREKLGAKIIIESNKGHFSDDARIKELPIVLKELSKIS